MPSYHINRTAEDLKRKLTALLRDVKDPRAQGKILTVVRVHLSGDGAVAKVFVSAMEGYDAAREAVQGLKSAAGFLRGELGRRLQLRKAPELRFVADNSIETGTEIIQKIASINAAANPEDAKTDTNED